MGKRVLYILVALLFSCSKETANSDLLPEPPSPDPPDTTDVVKPDTLIIPLNDLGTDKYRGYTGGLYPNGANEPSGTYAENLMTASRAIVPLNLAGEPETGGKIVFISMGASTGGKNMDALIAKTVDNPDTNPDLYLINCNQGANGASLSNISNPLDPYWLRVNHTIENKTSYKQVQVAYLETDDPADVSWPDRPLTIKVNLQSALRVMKNKFPNLKLVYVLGRTRTFPGVKLWNIEPGPYYFGWACKWAIEDQINGTDGTGYQGRDAVAPMLAWGFYQWADSLPRKTDGFSWRSYQTSDALHATPEGQDTLSGRFQRFLLTDKFAQHWYANH